MKWNIAQGILIMTGDLKLNETRQSNFVQAVTCVSFYSGQALSGSQFQKLCSS